MLAIAINNNAATKLTMWERCGFFPLAAAWTTKPLHTSHRSIAQISSGSFLSKSKIARNCQSRRCYPGLFPIRREASAQWHRLFSTTTPPEVPKSKKHVSTNKEESEEAYQELQWLSQEIRKHDELYYTSQPEISDDEFDALVQREEVLEEEFPQLLRRWQKESGLGLAATRRGRVGVSLGVNEFNSTLSSSTTKESSVPTQQRLKREHLAPMLSLDNVHNDEQLCAWLKRIHKAVVDESDYDDEMTINASSSDRSTRVTILTEPKLDGVSLSLRYRRNYTEDSLSKDFKYSLEWASTRGDGMQGQDVTPAIRPIKSIPSSLIVQETDLPDQLEVRGEIVLFNSIFEQLALDATKSTSNPSDTNCTNNTKAFTSFSNARNAASGILLRKESSIEEDQTEAERLRSQLHFFAYDLQFQQKRHADSAWNGLSIREFLSEAGFSIPHPIAVTELDLYHQNDALFEENIEQENDGEDKVKSTSHSPKYFDSRLAPMQSYYSALQNFREDGGSKASTPNESSYTYDWGDFEMDGCVHKVSDNGIRKYMGRSMKSPKWAVAHKFPPKAVVTKLVDVTLQVGRTGSITPIAILEPVQVGGVIIQRATLHNFGHMQQILNRTEIASGTPVLVRRAGEVIPQVVRCAGVEPTSVPEEDMISLLAPAKCPACSSPVITEDTSSSPASVGQVIRCGGPSLTCPPRAVTSLVHAYSRDAMDITGLSESRIKQLLDSGILRRPSDVFVLEEEEWEKIEALSGWGKKSCLNLRATTQRVATNGISLSRFIYSLGARHLGKHSSQIVASCYKSVSSFLETIDAGAKWDSRQSIEDTASGVSTAKEDCDLPTLSEHPFAALNSQLGIGPAVIESLLDFSKNQELVEAAKALAKAVRVADEAAPLLEETRSDDVDSTGNRPWKGFRVVFTGSIPNYTRTEASTAAKRLGAKATPGSVSKSTDLVVCGAKGGKKLEQAQKFGIPTITAEEFLALLERQND